MFGDLSFCGMHLKVSPQVCSFIPGEFFAAWLLSWQYYTLTFFSQQNHILSVSKCQPVLFLSCNSPVTVSWLISYSHSIVKYILQLGPV